MRLAAFSVTNFRSLTNQHQIRLAESTVLLGRNNEGKSNVLHALNIAMNALKVHARDISPHAIPLGQRYYWERDFPLSLQSRARGTDSIFRLEFELTSKEIQEFREAIKSRLDGSLPIEVKIGVSGQAKIHVPKRGPGGNALSEKSASIARYIAQRIDFNYIPAVRTADEALSVVNEMLSQELAQLEDNEQYQECLAKIEALQQPILNQLSNSIKSSLRQFLPDIKAVDVVVQSAARRKALRNKFEVYVDDGSRTLLDYKGDGVKSLAALGLLKDASSGAAVSVIAIEEPESHLHPGAIHALKGVIEQLSTTNQVVLTTHCPLFADRGSVGRNVIVDKNSAKPAKTIGAIREILGVRASDNLVNASHVVVVEGPEDVTALSAILSFYDPDIAKALKQHLLVLEPIGGAGNLAYKLTQLQNALCITHVVLDHDLAGTEAFEKAEEQGLLDVASTTFTTRKGAPASELEDLYDLAIYKDAVLGEFGVDLSTSNFRSNKKWSERVRTCFETQGKPWRNKDLVQVKAVVAEAVSENPGAALNPHHRSPVDALIRAIKSKMKLNGDSEQQ
ncbi:ATP-dependent nuclease [Herbaspirillum huttiense]|uniref:ATP-dependent nuclease n=1 Tax=Herbaspirillum huttiense TaxID=863372 RepID=UPI002176A7E6|nr:ATP-binding protein [Herbaspirillum huttiense]UWE15092.1 ATP-binding protein [Herbaspirillum huttiense]